MLWKTLICQENPLNFCFTLKGMGAGLLVKRLNQFCMNTHCIAHKKKLSNKIYAFIQSLNNIIWFRSIMHSKKIPIFFINFIRSFQTIQFIFTFRCFCRMLNTTLPPRVKRAYRTKNSWCARSLHYIQKEDSDQSTSCPTCAFQRALYGFNWGEQGTHEVYLELKGGINRGEN